MTLAFNLPTCPPSFLLRFDPRWKLVGLLLAALAAMSFHTAGPALAALAGALLLVMMARLPIGWYLQRLATSLVMFTVFLAWQPLIVQTGDETLDIGFFTLSMTGLTRLIVLSAKIAGMISLMLVLLATTPLPRIFKAARALWMPRMFVFLMLLTYRYVFLLMDEFAGLRTALRVRGFRNGADLHSYRTIGQVAGTLLVRSHERSERVGQAMRCRGFDGEFRALEDFRAAWPDVLAFAVIVGYAASLLAWDRLAGGAW